MFRQLTPLQPREHQQLRFNPRQPYDFAREQMLIPLVAAETARIAREMPIVFPLNGGLPQALVGVNQGQNMHVKEGTGHWIGRYIPAHIRRYPFMLAAVPSTEAAGKKGLGSEQQYIIQFDAEASHLERPDGLALFDDQGQATETLQQIQKVLTNLERENHRTLGLVGELEAAGLLAERQIHVGEEDKGGKRLAGIRLVDEKALAELDADTLAKLRTSGALALVYAHLLSLNNLRDGLLAQMIRTPDVADQPMSLDELFNEGDDDFTFDFDS
ncbi:SapC family protein [Halomonas sp. SpR1]|uniref:SapC family protein n=1 Tax=Halomonas sp. SpR1 TaxID=3050462 RepID=UPI0027E45332|nr:SapC family protein [Halomonas sp. SpR1]MDQ7733691.1 SapC family protein [Halomonas sp. SpR1]